ncbi:MAG: type III-A CRISPR-associated RAMP protein Csm4 [Clostridiales bacterium]|nr:type III-A CRISPR-associated RAMP protein Csm4 [Clostridiales bacterium]
MKYKIYKLSFPNGIHIGGGSLSSAENTIHSDTLFSALCIEALHIGGESLLETLVGFAQRGKLCISNALPYIDNCFYVPKPMCRVESTENDLSLKKEFKKMSYIPVDSLSDYLSGKSDPVKINEELSGLGKKSVFQKVFIKQAEDNELYNVGVYKFSQNCGLYFVLGYEENDAAELFENILSSLEYSGLGGKRASGYGRFKSTAVTAAEFENRLNTENKRYMALSVSMAADDELEDVLDGASYKIIKRSGFVQSDTYSERQLKKRDLYVFAPGAVFTKRFKGDIFDVSQDGAHPVYRYEKPMLIGIGG